MAAGPGVGYLHPMRILTFLAGFLLVTPTAQAIGWDSIAGGINGNQLQVELGFSSLPRVQFEHQLTRIFSIGAEASFDYGYWTPGLAVTPGVTLGMPMRLSLYNRGRATVGMRFEPGFLLQFYDPVQLGVMLGVGINAGGWVVHNFLIGGGLDMPIAVLIPNQAGNPAYVYIHLPINAAYAYFPLLFGPFFEFHPGNVFGLTFDVKLGPGIYSNGTVTFALKALLGFAFHF